MAILTEKKLETMNKVIRFITVFVMTLVCVIRSNAQEVGITKFLGIPVDGTKSEMINKLQSKGYVYDSRNDYLLGEFDGQDVKIFIGTNKHKVWRIAVVSRTPYTESTIRTRFNKLVSEFSSSDKYLQVPIDTSYAIPYTSSVSDGIDYQMSVYNRHYEASYVQYPEWYTKDSLASSVNKSAEYMSGNDWKEYCKKTWINSFAYERAKSSLVWFMIYRIKTDNYQIVLFYENRRNMAKGEDL